MYYVRVYFTTGNYTDVVMENGCAELARSEWRKYLENPDQDVTPERGLELEGYCDNHLKETTTLVVQLPSIAAIAFTKSREVPNG